MIMHLRKARNKLFLLGLLVLFSCSKQEKEYFYAFYYEKDSVPSHYLVRNVVYENSYRIDIISRVKSDQSYEQIDKEKFGLTKGGLDKITLEDDSVISKPYLTTLSNKCVEYRFKGNMVNDVWSTVICFLGKEDILIESNIEYKNALKFRKKKGGVESIVYYDTDFILLKEEYVSGYADEYRIVRLDTRPRL